MTNPPAYTRAYEARRRARCRAAGQCVACGHPARPGVAANHQPYSRCTRCIVRQAKYNAASLRRAQRRQPAQARRSA